jgi:hypothetical protein
LFRTWFSWLDFPFPLSLGLLGPFSSLDHLTLCFYLHLGCFLLRFSFLGFLGRLTFCFHLSHFSAASRIDSALPSFFEPATSLQLALSPGDQFCLLAWYGEEPVSTKDVGHIESALAALKPIQDLAKNWDIDIAAW